MLNEVQIEGLVTRNPWKYDRDLFFRVVSCREAGMPAKPDVHPHTLRNTFSKNLIDAGPDLYNARGMGIGSGGGAAGGLVYYPFGRFIQYGVIDSLNHLSFYGNAQTGKIISTSSVSIKKLPGQISPEVFCESRILMNFDESQLDEILVSTIGPGIESP